MIFRKDETMKICKNKDVLHLGFIQHNQYEEKIKNDDWLHGKISKVTSRLVGFDYLKKDVEIIKEKYGFEAYYADVMKLEKVQLEDKFDVILCGELIEHIENPGLMLEGIKRFMHKDSLVIITTPNPWARHRIKLINAGTLEHQWLNKEHVSWYSFETLKQLLTRKNFEEISFDYYYGENENDFFKNAKGIIGKLKIFKRKSLAKITQPQNYDGLFFVAKLHV